MKAGAGGRLARCVQRRSPAGLLAKPAVLFCGPSNRRLLMGLALDI